MPRGCLINGKCQYLFGVDWNVDSGQSEIIFRNYPIATHQNDGFRPVSLSLYIRSVNPFSVISLHAHEIFPYAEPFENVLMHASTAGGFLKFF